LKDVAISLRVGDGNEFALERTPINLLSSKSLKVGHLLGLLLMWVDLSRGG